MIARDFQAKQEKKMMENGCKVGGLSAFFGEVWFGIDTSSES
jgi:hypothetical protein